MQDILRLFRIVNSAVSRYTGLVGADMESVWQPPLQERAVAKVSPAINYTNR